MSYMKATIDLDNQQTADDFALLRLIARTAEDALDRAAKAAHPSYCYPEAEAATAGLRDILALVAAYQDGYDHGIDREYRASQPKLSLRRIDGVPFCHFVTHDGSEVGVVQYLDGAWRANSMAGELVATATTRLDAMRLVFEASLPF